MPRYRYALDEGAVTAMLVLNDHEIGQLLAAIEAVANNPHAKPDSYSLDRQGRPLANVATGRFLIGYWPDHRARTVQVFRIDPLEPE